ncbi:hypothetical protein JTE90_006267 [Oedothorax gibbosus]|uniref:Uncharacterized protein n=1 Tax=Oedothorax gibbosus TaxID=931172 RepID=A0AAV6U7T0_9ARAC|nr:hypothetical protein JTE90_006267 [Oedothorax gibbosus]
MRLCFRTPTYTTNWKRKRILRFRTPPSLTIPTSFSPTNWISSSPTIWLSSSPTIWLFQDIFFPHILDILHHDLEVFRMLEKLCGVSFIRFDRAGWDFPLLYYRLIAPVFPPFPGIPMMPLYPMISRFVKPAINVLRPVGPYPVHIPVAPYPVLRPVGPYPVLRPVGPYPVHIPVAPYPVLRPVGPYPVHMQVGPYPVPRPVGPYPGLAKDFSTIADVSLCRA